MRDVWRAIKVRWQPTLSQLTLFQPQGSTCCVGPWQPASSRTPPAPVPLPQTEGKAWGQEGVGSWSDTAEAAIRAVMLAAR